VILSQTAVYALRATLCLASHGPSARIRVDDIAEQLSVPRNYLSKILHSLARGGVLTSSRGPGGGFQLARPARDLMLSEVVEQFDELPTESGCLLGRNACSEQDPCAAHHRWKNVSSVVDEFFRETSIGDLSFDRNLPFTPDTG
jgi:Rrf2 family iron-sulfur cluster assembly transcriptional regulator